MFYHNLEFLIFVVLLGAVYVGTSNGELFFYNCTFQDNSATVDGGAFYMNTLNNNASIQRSFFYDNAAVDDGGALGVSSSNENLIIAHNVFSGILTTVVLYGFLQATMTQTLPTIHSPITRPLIMGEWYISTDTTTTYAF